MSKDPVKRARQMANLIPFDSANNPKPCGRPKGIVAYIKERTNNLEDAIDLHVKVMKGEKIDGIKQTPGLYYRLDSAKWLVEKCYGNRLIFSEEDAAKYDLRSVILMELTQKKDGDIRGQTAGQVVEAEQLLQDPVKE